MKFSGAACVFSFSGVACDPCFSRLRVRVSMPDIHTIRLRGPWQMEPLERFAPAEASGTAQGDDELPLPGRVKLPTTCEAALPHGFRGRVRFARRFQRPTGLEPHETVHLVVETPWTIVGLTLNERPLEFTTSDAGSLVQRAPVRLNLTDLLADTNLLAIEVEYRAQDTAEGAPAGQAISATPGSSANRDASGAALLGEVRLEIE